MNEIYILYTITFAILIYVGWNIGIIKAQLKTIEEKIEKGE